MLIITNETIPNISHPHFIPRDTKGTESAILIVVASVGMIGNFAIIVTILVLQDLRKTSSAFLFHHSVLDFVKSVYCLPFAYSIMNEREPVFCNILGGSFIVFVTTSAFNLLAMVMNEAYQFADMNLGIKDSGNFCCVIFGICMIWFTSLILNLGVAFIPGNPSFKRDVGHCTFLYGITGNYVLHVLWISLVSFAMVLTVMYLRKLHCDIKMNSYYRLSTLIRATIHIDANNSPEITPDDQAEKIMIKKIERFSLRKVYILMTMTLCYVLFWYPLFMLTLVDPNFTANPFGYRVLTMFACSNAAVTPFIFICLIKKNCCCKHDFPELNLGMGANTSSQLSLESIRHTPNRRLMGNERTSSGIYNEFFSRADRRAASSQETECMTQSHASSEMIAECSTSSLGTRPKQKRTRKTPNSLWIPSPTL
jgi:hypothetical protein